MSGMTSGRSGVNVPSVQQYVRLCDCGCGQPTRVAMQTDTRKGYRKGDVHRLLLGHAKGNRRSADYRVNPDTGCWEWLGGLGSGGYGQTWFRGKNMRAHRAYYIQAKGEVPSDLELDHLCRVRHCVNPDHLEPVTHGENVRRAYAARKVAS